MSTECHYAECRDAGRRGANHSSVLAQNFLNLDVDIDVVCTKSFGQKTFGLLTFGLYNVCP